jgi:hypothetical protein
MHRRTGIYQHVINNSRYNKINYNIYIYTNTYIQMTKFKYVSKKHTCMCHTCKNRILRKKDYKLRCKLGKLQHNCCNTLPCANEEELKYEHYSYNGQFHKGFAHDLDTGKLITSSNYTNMKKALFTNDQVLLASIPLADGSTIKLANPLASLSTPLIGASYCSLQIDTPPAFDSASGAAEMVEVYALVVSRDVPFIEYNEIVVTNPTLISILDSTHMNNPDILSNLKYYTPRNVPFTGKTLFRGSSSDEKIGPYVSQLLLLDVPMGPGTFVQKYTTLLPRPNKCEWGITSTETIAIQNGNLTNLSIPDIDPIKRYVFDGRSLAELVHRDAVYQLFYQAALVLLGLGVSADPESPSYPNQSGFITSFGGASLLCAIAEVSGIALKHAWYWKWQVFRKLRPEVFGLAVHNVKTGKVPNANNYNLDNVVLDNAVLDDINGLYTDEISYTLPLCYPEGCPGHPSYPAGHAVIAGACCTILKIFTDSDKLWGTLPGVTNGSLSNGISGPVEATSDGSDLQSYTDKPYGGDAASMTINGEIDKLGSNISIARNFAGVHYRSDGEQGLHLGEQIAIKYLEDMLSSSVEKKLDGSIPKLTFKKFDGTTATIIPTIHKKC